MTKRGVATEFFYDVVLKYGQDDCLIWPYYRDRCGYGKLRIPGKSNMVHRVACEIVHGDPPTEDHQASHSCGNGHLGCVNPKHLSWKTRKENKNDEIEHGTRNYGTRNGRAKLSEEIVSEIASSDLTQRALAKKFGVSQPIICRIKSGKIWGHASR